MVKIKYSVFCLLLCIYCNIVAIAEQSHVSQTPYGGSAISLPGRIEIENYDLGGQGFAFNDSDTLNSGGEYRSDGVDIQGALYGEPGYYVGWITPGEWLEYTVNVASTGKYDFGLRISTPWSDKTLHIEVDGVNVTDTIHLPGTSGWQNWQTVTVNNIDLTSGSHVMRVYFETGSFNFSFIDISPTSTNQTPFSNVPIALPGRIEIEDFDIGGQGIAYNDEDGINSGGQYRTTEGVDIENCLYGEPGYYVGWTRQGEWLEYTVNVGYSGKYDFDLRISTPWQNQTLYIESDGIIISDTITLPSTGGWQNWETFTLNDIDLTSGSHIIRIFFLTGNLNFSYIHVNSKGQTPYNGVATSIPGRLEFENYDVGGQGNSFYETTSTNLGGLYRSESVDIDVMTNGESGHYVGWTEAGEWLEYTVNIINSGIYEFQLRAATSQTDQTLHIEMDSVNITGSITLAHSGNTKIWSTSIIPGISLSSGTHVLKVYLETGNIDLNYLDIYPSGGNTPYTGIPINLPGRIELEDFDLGGQGISYNDSDSVNSGGQYRSEWVDVEGAYYGEPGYYVGWTKPGEWLKYSVNVTTSGKYDFDFRVSTPWDDRKIHIEVDGINVTGSILLPPTNGYQNWQTFQVKGINLTSGNHVFKLFCEDGSFNLSYIDVIKDTTDVVTCLPETFPAPNICVTNPWDCGQGALQAKNSNPVADRLTEHYFELNNKKVYYLSYVPTIAEIPSEDKYPLIISLHGNGELTQEDSNCLCTLRKFDLLKGINNGEDSVSETFLNGNFILFAPHGTYQSNGIPTEVITKTIDYAICNYPIDTNRIYLIGASSGGGNAIRYIVNEEKHANKIAAVVTFSPNGEGNYNFCNTLFSSNCIGYWQFKSENDGMSSTKTYDSLLQCNLPEAPKLFSGNYGGAHWPYDWRLFNRGWAVPGNDDIFTWLLSHKLGCEAITSCDEIDVTASIVTSPTCPGSCDGKATVSVSPQIAGTTIKWNSLGTGKDLINACAGSNIVSITTPSGCHIVDTLIITAQNTTCPGRDSTGEKICLNNTLNLSVVSKVEKVCFSDDSYVDIQISGGQAPLTYTWTVPGSDSSETFLSDKEDFENPVPGNYLLKVKDDNNCVKELSFTVDGPESELNDSVNVVPAICIGAKASATVTGFGGEGSIPSDYSYLWSDGNTQRIRTDLDSGTYKIVISDIAGCEVTSTIRVDQPVFSGKIFSSQKLICPGESSLLTASIVVDYNFFWTGPTTSDTSSFRSFNVITPGEYRLRYSKEGCDYQDIFVTIGEDSGCYQKKIICQPIDFSVDVSDPAQECISQKIISAQANGVYRYNSYIAEAKKKFKSDYIKEILSSTNESLTIEYTDKEEHYTLYYYDQSGNMVRTVPPAGIKPLQNLDLATAENDLQNNTLNTITDHSFATTYRYNSLNQLVAQDVPDNTKQDLWENTSSSITLDQEDSIVAISYSNQDKGTLISNNETETKIFTTSDGGKTWLPSNNVGINDLFSIQKISNTASFAAGKAGTFLASVDNGQTWLIKPVPTQTDLIEVYFSSSTDGLILSSDGTIWSTSDGGSSWSDANVSLKQKLAIASPSQQLTDAWFDGSDIWVTSKDINRGHIWFSQGSGNGNAQGNGLGNVIWTEQTSFSPGEFSAVIPDGTGDYRSAGPPGSLYKILSLNGNSSLTRTDLSVGILKLAKKSGESYLAIGTDSKLYTSFNGINWILPAGGSGDFIQVITTPSEDIALKSSGSVVRSSSGTWSSQVSTGITIPGKLRHLNYPVLRSATGYSHLVIAGGQNAAYALSAAGPWKAVSFSSLPNGIQFTDVWVALNKTWVLLSGTTLYQGTEAVANDMLSPLSILSTGVSGIFPSGGTLYAVMDDRTIKSTSNGTTLMSNALPSLPGSADLVDLCIQSSTQAVALFNDGTVYHLIGTVWNNISKKTVPDALAAIEVASTGGYAAGETGEIYKKVGNDWVSQPHSNPGLTVNKIGIDVTGDLYLGSNSGLYQYNSTNGLINVNGTSGIITAVDVKILGGMLAASSSGSLYRNSGISWSNQTYPNPVPLYDVDAYSYADALAAGAGGKILTNNGSGWNEVSSAKTLPLYALSYSGSMKGIAVGKQGTAVITADGGLQWTPVYSGTLNDLKTVDSRSGKAVAGGLNGTLIYSANDGINWAPSSVTPLLGSSSVTDVHFANSSTVLALAGTRLLKSTTSGLSFTNEMNLTSIGQSVCIDSSGYGFLVGDNGLAYRITPNGGTYTYTVVAPDSDLDDDIGSGIPSGAMLKTVEFTDRLTGYITGANGLIMKTVDGGAQWKVMPTDAGTGTPILALNGNENGSLVSAGGALTSLRDRARIFSSRFWYDEVGRLVLSQNSKQYNIAAYNPPVIGGSGNLHAFSYTLYDKTGRITEVGELLTRETPLEHKYESQVLYQNFKTFVSNGVRREIITTCYDTARYIGLTSEFIQENLRSRVASVTYKGTDNSYDRATHYSYDVHGNVKSLLQEVKKGTILKKLDYEYDLVSGKVNRVIYQQGKPDQFIHQYDYDADNRITSVKTSRDGEVWDTDARYMYYGHGPLSRVVTGEIDTTDFAYTLQGWLKGAVGKNFSYALGYFSGDYTSIGTNTLEAAPVDKSLYNGNIATMTSKTPSLSASAQVQQFEYDQLNRIMSSKLAGQTGVYSTGYMYDPSGNLTKVKRNNGSGQLMDSLTYHYEQKSNGYQYNTNKLRWVDDVVTSTELTDIEDQTTDNYDYDDIGNLVRDVKESIENIEWNVHGKIKKVTRVAGSNLPDLEFEYDGSGNRILKKVIHKNGNPTLTYYLRDASGNVMAVYDQEGSATLSLTENHIYGSSRLGVSRVGNLSDLPTIDSVMGYHKVSGLKDYELTDHLGNVRVVLSDLRTPTGLIGVSAAYDYYPFGMQMPGRTLNANNYRYGFNGKEIDQETQTQDYGFRIYNPRIARFLSVDPLTTEYPELTPYQFASNTPIQAIDLDGLEMKTSITMSKGSDGKPVFTVEQSPIVDNSSNTAKSLNLPPSVSNQIAERKYEKFLKSREQTVRAVEFGEWFTPYERAAQAGVMLSPVGLGNSTIIKFGKPLTQMVKNIAEQSASGKSLGDIDLFDASSKLFKIPDRFSIPLESTVDISLNQVKVFGYNKNSQEVSIDILRKSLNKKIPSENPLVEGAFKVSSAKVGSALKKKTQDENTE